MNRRSAHSRPTAPILKPTLFPVDFAVLAVLFGPEAVTGAADEHIFQARLVYRDALDLARECLDHVGDEAMSGLNFQPHPMIQYRGMQSEPLRDALRQRIGLVRVKQNHVATDLALQFGGCPKRDDAAVGINRKPIAAFGFFHEVSGDQHGYALFVTQNLQVLPEIAASAGIETGGGLVEQ